MTERKERNKSQNKNRLSTTPLPKKMLIKIKKNPQEVIDNLTSKKIINKLEKENKKLKEENNKLKKEIEDKDKIIKKQNIIIKQQKNSLNYIVNNNKKENKKLWMKKE